MLVLRRRPNEAIVIDGGLTLKLLQVSGRSVWLSLTHPELDAPVEMAVPAKATTSAELSFRGIRSLSREGATTTLEPATPEDGDLEAVLTLTRRPDDRLRVGTLSFTLLAIEDERLYLRLEGASLPAPITVSIVSISTVDARIGVDAPAEIRVNRAELWEQMQQANAAAAGQWTAEDLAALTTDTP